MQPIREVNVLFSFFKKHPRPDSRDLEQVIYDIAEHNRDEDFQLFYRLMAVREVFLPIVKASIPAPAQPGVPYVVGPTDRLAIRTVRGPDDQPWAFATTQPTHPHLAGEFAGMSWLEFLRMVMKINEVRGALLQ